MSNSSHMKLALIFCLLLALPAAGFAGSAVHVAGAEIAVDSGLRTDQFDWNIAGTPAGTDPNILSELIWKDLQISQLRLRANVAFDLANLRSFQPYLRGQLGLGRIYAGKNQDSDYAGDNRTQEFSRSNNAADQGNVLDFSVATGPKFALLEERLTLIPLLGYSYHRQNLTLLEGSQTIPAHGAFSGLNSSFDAEWWGGWLGIEGQWQLSRRLRFHLLTEYHKVKYYAEADWNLRPEFAHPLSFIQDANGSGWVNEIGLDYFLREKWSLAFLGTFQRWQTEAGRDRVFLSQGFAQDTRLNQVNWESIALQVGLTYHF